MCVCSLSYMIYLLTAIGLSPGGSTHLHKNNTYNNTNNNWTTQITTNVEECGPCPAFASFTLAFALQLRKRHGKISVKVRKTSVRVQYTYYQNTHTLRNPHKHTHYKTLTNTHITKPSQTHTLQNPHKHTHYKTPTNYKTLTNTHITKPSQTHTLQNPHKHTHYKTHSYTHTHTHTHYKTT